MKLSKWLKVLLGLVTAWVVFAPVLFMGMWLVMLPLIVLADQRTGEPGPVFFMIFGIFMFIAMLSAFIRWGMSAFYLTHVILNREGNDTARVLLGLGSFILPFIAMPFYYFVYVWPEQPPAWAMRPAAEENKA